LKQKHGQPWLDNFWRCAAEYDEVHRALDTLSARAAKSGHELNLPLVLHELFCGVHEGLSWKSYQHTEMFSSLEGHGQLLDSFITKMQRLREASHQILNTSPYNTAKLTLKWPQNHIRDEDVEYEDMLYALQNLIFKTDDAVKKVSEMWGKNYGRMRLSARCVGLHTLKTYFKHQLDENCLKELDTLWSAAETIPPADSKRAPKAKRSSGAKENTKGEPVGDGVIKMQLRRFRERHAEVANEIEEMITSGKLFEDPRWQWPKDVNLGIPSKWATTWSAKERPSFIDELAFRPRPQFAISFERENGTFKFEV